jgi:cytochrome P450
MYPVTMFVIPRMVKSVTEIMGYQVDPGTLITVGTYVIHHREDIYPEANVFKPERFLDRNFSPYQFLPFGGGLRGCIGGEIALYLLKLAVAIAVSRHSLKLVNQRPINPQRRNTILTPTGLKMIKHIA